MIHRAIILAAILAAFGMLAAPTVTKAQQSHSQRNLAGLFVHTGVMELMTRGNERAIANVGFVIEADALVLIDTGRRCSRGLMRREIVWIGRVRPRTTARLRNISLPLRPERVADH